MYFFNCTCLCLSGYKPYIIKKTKFESDCQIIGSAQKRIISCEENEMNLFQPLPGIERVSPVKACGLAVDWI